MAAPEPDLLDRRRENERVHWIDRLVQRGMTVAQAEALIDGGARLHDVQEALEAGCDPGLAFQIFGPL